MESLDHESCYQACRALDTRFDGVFFVGVLTTGIYCRTICRARKPKRENCRFFLNATLAEQAGLRPCKLCRPEQSPGYYSEKRSSSVVSAVVQRMEGNLIERDASQESIAKEMNISARQLRRIFRDQVGTSPIAYAQTQRLLMAKRLLSETSLPITSVALASGFGSVRRCNALFHSRYRMSPTEFRSKVPRTENGGRDFLTVTLGFRPPYAWRELIAFFAARAIQGVECIQDHCYMRTLRINGGVGWIRVRKDDSQHVLKVDLSSELIESICQVLSLVRRAFDLNASPSDIIHGLSVTSHLESSLQANPGLRVPGTMNGFETAIRAIIGQQVSVAAATTVMNRLVQHYGEAMETPWPALNRCSITPEIMLSQNIRSLQAIGLTESKAMTIVAFTSAVVDGQCSLEASADPERAIAKFQELRGIGPWTANYFGMRILNWPNAFLREDLIVRQQLSPMGPKEIEWLSQHWRPWRAYAVMHLWTMPKRDALKHTQSNRKKRTP